MDLVLYTKIGLGDGQQATSLGYKNFQIQLQEFLGIIMLLFLRRCLKIRIENWNVGGLNGSYADIKVGNTTLEK
jgi:molybdopterin-containing oxidoreductase family iron-sulfur binding subunit